MAFLRYYWFDIITLIVVCSGLAYGYRRGLTLELVPLLQWITLIAVCGTYYQPIGAPIARWVEIQPNEAFVFVYLLLGAVVFYLFWTIKKTIAKGLPGSKCFGNAETPLGAVAGACRFLCIQFVCITLIAANYIPPEELSGSSYYYQTSENNVPTPADVQRGIFLRSRSGRLMKYYFGRWLIAAQPPVKYDDVIVEGYHQNLRRSIEGEHAK